MSWFVDASFVLKSGDGKPGQSVTLYLTIVVSANAPPHPILPIDTAHAIATGIDVSPMEQATENTNTGAQDSIETTPFIPAATSELLSPSMHDVPIVTSSTIPPVLDVQAMSPAENALRDADEATKAINLTCTWESTVDRIKWVIDTVSPVAGVRHSAMTSYLLLD